RSRSRACCARSAPEGLLVKRLFAGLVAATLLGAPIAVAQVSDSLTNAKRQELEDIQRKARENREAATRLKGQENKALSQLKRTERQLGVRRRRLNDLPHRRQRPDAQLDLTRGDRQRNLGRLSGQRARLG